MLLHACVVQLVKQCQAMLEAGRVYCQTSKSFVNGLRELGHHCSRDKMMEVTVALAIGNISCLVARVL